MGWLGLDDTDTVADGCTTFSIHALIESLPNDVIVGDLRLVRLWPYAQQRTRGNAAVAVELNPPDEVSFLAFLERYWQDNLLPLKGRITTSASEQRSQSATDPGMVWFSKSTEDSAFYLEAVRNEIRLDSIPTATKSWGGMGRIGATAAAVWPQHDSTWEAVCWRKEERWSITERLVCEDALAQADGMADTFLTRDPRTKRSLISPRGTCPVLFGVRSRTKEGATLAARLLAFAEGTEPSIAWRVFCTNQATDDHLTHSHRGVVQSVEVLGRGTTILNMEHQKWLAFAESGDVKNLAQSLQTGDEVEAFGLQPEAGVLHIEKLRITKPVALQHRPMCSDCNRRMKSMGKGQGVRCPLCKKRQVESWVSVPKPTVNLWVQPPFDARRHLAKPLEWSLGIDENRNA